MKIIIGISNLIMLRMSINIIIDYIIIGGRGLPSEACTSILTREILIKGLWRRLQSKEVITKIILVLYKHPRYRLFIFKGYFQAQHILNEIITCGKIHMFVSRRPQKFDKTLDSKTCPLKFIYSEKGRKLWWNFSPSNKSR